MNKDLGDGGYAFENIVGTRLKAMGYCLLKDHRIKGYGKVWEFDFYIPEIETLILCKNVNPLAKTNWVRFYADILRMIDVRAIKDYFCIMLYNNFTTSVPRILLCTAYKIYLLFSVNGLYILNEKDYGTNDHIKKINDEFISLRDPPRAEGYLIKDELINLISYYPQTIKTLENETGKSRDFIINRLDKLEKDGIIFKRRWSGGQGAPNHYYLKNNYYDLRRKGGD